MTLSIFLLMLKPQIGIIFCFFLLPNRFWFGTLLVSTIAVVLLSLQPLFIDDPLVTIGNYLEILRVYYPKITSNEAINMTGLRHFIYLVVGVSLPPIIFVLTAILGAVSLGFCWRRRAKEPLDENQYQLLIGVLLILFILVPMHIYYSIIIAPLIVLIVKRSVIVQAATALFLLMVFRSNNLASLTGFYSDENKHSIGSSIEVVSGMLLIGFFLWIYFRRFREMLPDKLKK
ncbi:MAG: hypothetical protein ACI9D5_002135 [Candidatus Endobugula sp.]|jgi:hypothetical protein